LNLLVLKLIFENATAGRNTGCRSVVNRADSTKELQLTVSYVVSGVQNCIIDTVAIKLRFVFKHNVTLQMAIAIEPLAKVQPLSKIFWSEMLHSLHAVWIHAVCMQCSPHSP
jgi:hypothetical protein